MSHFERYIGIDYSGASSADSRQKGLRIYSADSNSDPIQISTPSVENGARYWSRQEVAEWLLNELASDSATIVGIDHAFSFPDTYFYRYELNTWDQFIRDFVEHWPLHEPHTFVDFIRDNHPARIGDPKEFRITDKRTSTAKSVFKFDVRGQVAKSTHAGIPWLLKIRQELGSKVRFWPFDGWDIVPGKHLIAESYPAILKNRYPKEDRTQDEHDAYAIARWLKESDQDGFLERYLNPPLTDEEQKVAEREGWILGVY